VITPVGLEVGTIVNVIDGIPVAVAVAVAIVGSVVVVKAVGPSEADVVVDVGG